MVAVLNSLSAWIFNWTLIQVGSSVGLSLNWGRQFHYYHFQEGLSGVDPFLENVFEEEFSLELLFIGLEHNFEMVQHLPDSFFVVFHNISAKSNNWLHDELDEASSQLGAIISSLVLFPFLSFLIKIVVTPKFLHHLVKVNLEFLGVDTSKFGQSEGPTEESGTESYGSLGGIDLLGFAHIITFVGGYDNVGVFNNSLEVLIHGFSIDLEFKDTSVDLVDEEDWLDLLS